MKKFIHILAILTFISGCSVIPYEEEFGCRLKDNFGKCISMGDAYTEAKTGVEVYPKMKPASEQDNSDDSDLSVGETAQPLHATNSNSNYNQYINGYYQELNKLVDNPITPMVKQAKTVRTLIIPYSSDGGKTMWGERYAHTIVQEPSFIYGQYMIKKPQSLESIMDKQE